MRELICTPRKILVEALAYLHCADIPAEFYQDLAHLVSEIEILLEED